MKLKLIDQILISSLSSDTLRPGQEIEVDDGFGAELLERHPAVFLEIGGKAEPAPANKAAKAPANKGGGV
jgi:hypothetical protein